MPLLLSLLGPLLGKVIDAVGSKVGVDMNSDELKSKKIELELELQKMVSAVDLKQLDINLAEAANTSRTWPTWREMLGYICAAAVAYHFVIQQFLAFMLAASGIPVELPMIEMTGIMTILSAMLGVHFVDSRYNSPQGAMPIITKVSKGNSGQPAPASKTGRVVNDIWVEGD